jgi:hypothetical protein
MNKQNIIVGIALAFLLLGTAFSAEAKPSVVRTNGDSAYAYFPETTPDGVATQKYVSVWEANGETSVYVSIYTNDLLGNWKNEYGILTTKSDVFSIGKANKLNSASLVVPEIQLGTDVCGLFTCEFVPTRNLTDFQLQLIGVGNIQKGNYNYRYKDGNVFFKANEFSSTRRALAIASSNEEVFGMTNDAMINSFRSATVEMAKAK